MKRLLGVSLISAATLFVLWGTADTLAQDKKAGKGGKASSSSGGGTIELVESKDGKFRFSVRDADGKYMGGSAVGHATEKEAKEAAEEMKKVMATATYVSKKADAKTPKKTKKD